MYHYSSRQMLNCGTVLALDMNKGLAVVQDQEGDLHLFKWRKRASAKPWATCAEWTICAGEAMQNLARPELNAGAELWIKGYISTCRTGKDEAVRFLSECADVWNKIRDRARKQADEVLDECFKR